MQNHWMKTLLYFDCVFKHFTLCMLGFALIFIFVEWVIAKIRKRALGYEIIFHWIALLPVGFTLLFIFISKISYLPLLVKGQDYLALSTMQAQVAVANLIMGILIICAFNQPYYFRLSATLAITLWLWGLNLIKIYSLYIKHTLNIINLQMEFWLYLLLPIILIICIRNLKISAKTL